MIILDNITKTFRSSKGVDFRALNGVSLEIKRGEIIGIVGKSGAGKSTLIRTINALEKPDSGRVLVSGQDVTALRGEALRRLRKNIGMIFQGFNLLASRTVRQNVAFPLELSGLSKNEIEVKVDQLLREVELWEKRDAYPGQLSGGQKQRVAIARALASDPEILLSDEATSALDPETTQSILKLLLKLRDLHGLTIVMISHQHDIMRQICDRIALIENGELQAVLDNVPQRSVNPEEIKNVIIPAEVSA